MNNFQRLLSAVVFIGFFLPWVEFTGDMEQMKENLNELMEMLGGFAEESPQYQEAVEQMELLNKMDGATGFDLSTTKFGEIGDSPILFMVPAIALFAGIYNKKKTYIIYPLLCGFCIFVNATFSGPVSTGLGLMLTYASLLIAFCFALGMPKDTDTVLVDKEVSKADFDGNNKGTDESTEESTEEGSEEGSDSGVARSI